MDVTRELTPVHVHDKADCAVNILLEKEIVEPSAVDSVVTAVYFPGEQIGLAVCNVRYILY